MSVMPQGRTEASITAIHEGYAYALDDWGTSYFIFHNAVERMGRWGFDDLKQGSRVELTPIDHPRGTRGIEVQIISL